MSPLLLKYYNKQSDIFDNINLIILKYAYIANE